MGPLNATQIAVEKLTRALAAHVAGKRAQARAAVVEALAGAPSSSFVQIVASRLLFHLGEVHGALATLAAAEQQAPDERTRLAVLDWIFELGSRGGYYREALCASTAAFASDPQRSSRHAAAAEFHSLLGDHESADRHCRAALAADPRDPARKLASARALRGLGRHTEARELLESVQLERRDARAEVELAQELVLAGAFAAAASRLHAALDAEPSLSSAHAELARLALWRNDLETAGKHARLALDADPRCGRARVVLAGIALFSGAPEACLAELERARASTPLDPELGVLRVEAEFRRERYAAALEAVTALDAMVPDSAEYFSLQVLRALVSHRLG
ncbi:MAG TPA: tetratricopeptide repeat protein, partial [Polyangiaceae bacterium]